MELTLTDNQIPVYSLLKTTHSKASDYFIFRPGVGTPADNRFFLTPHRKDYYLFVLNHFGVSRHWIDMVPHTLKPDTFYFTVPHQVHLKESTEITGAAICFTDEFLVLGGNEELKNLPIIRNKKNGHELTLTAGDLNFIKDILEKTVQEFEHNNNWKSNMLHAYLRILLIYLSRLYVEQYEAQDNGTERVLLKQFQELINKHYKMVHDVASYADMLHMSPGYLSEVIKQECGKPASELIHDRLMIEAKRLLFHTELSVKELAFDLGFSDVSYFVRFFKRLCGTTPIAYRNSNREKYHQILQA